MQAIIDGPTLAAFRTGLRGRAYAPGDNGYDEARRAWNLNAHQRPALVVVAGHPADVIAAVSLARERGLGVGVQATGHGVAYPCDGGVLINTSRMRGVRVDPEARTAQVEAGALWADVIPEAQEYGLAGLSGSSPYVGVVGYTMGGGLGWLGRKYGFNADSVRQADVVTAGGELRQASADSHPDLFWGIKGGGGNFGVVTSLEFALYPLTTVYGGGLYYPVERAPEVLGLYSRWTTTLPEEMTSSILFLHFPPLPELPEVLRGRSVIAMRACYCGDPPEAGEELLRPWRELLGRPLVDDFRKMPYRQIGAISNDPVDPVGAYGHVERLRDLSPGTIDTLVEVAGTSSESPLAILEVRQLGGALGRPPAEPSPIGHRDAPFIINGIGMTPTPEEAKRVQAYLAYVAGALRPHETGATYVNFLELADVTPQRVRAAYSPEDWERLVALKNRYDPDNLFRFNRNIPPSPGGGPAPVGQP